MLSSNCRFLTCIQFSQEAGKVVWYFQFLKKFPQFVVIHTAKDFSTVNKAEVSEKLVYYKNTWDFNNSKQLLILGYLKYQKAFFNMAPK